MTALAPPLSLRMASDSNSHVDRLGFPPEEFRDLLYAFHRLSPQQTLLIKRMKAGVFDTPAAEPLAGRASAKSVRPKRPVAREQLLSSNEARLILPLVVDQYHAPFAKPGLTRGYARKTTAPILEPGPLHQGE